MRRFLVTLFAAAFIASGSAFAQSTATKPSCAPGDPIVWVNTNSGVYHMQGDRYYGTTKAGTYLCKSAADAKQYHAASMHGKNGANSGTMSGAGAGAMSRGSAMPAMAASPDAMASPMGRHHRMHGGTMPSATTAPAAAYPTATATPAGSHRKHRHSQTAPGMSPSEAPVPAAT